MKNLISYPNDPFQVFINAVSRKENPDLRARLNAIQHLVQAEFDIYKNHFDANTLELISSNPVLEIYKEDLQSLYLYDSLTMREFRTAIENLQSDCIKYTCQYCGLDATTSLDHYLPQGSYSIFCVNPLNLVPACQSCNGPKFQIWIHNGIRVFLNPYLDILPTELYLFVEIFNEQNGDMNFRFTLRNDHGIDGVFFSRLESHFRRLHLADRMRRAATGYVTEFLNGIKRAKGRGTPMADITSEAFGKIADDRQAYGSNYWKSALEEALIQNPISLAKTDP